MSTLSLGVHTRLLPIVAEGHRLLLVLGTRLGLIQIVLGLDRAQARLEACCVALGDFGQALVEIGRLLPRLRARPQLAEQLHALHLLRDRRAMERGVACLHLDRW